MNTLDGKLRDIESKDPVNYNQSLHPSQPKFDFKIYDQGLSYHQVQAYISDKQLRDKIFVSKMQD